MTMTRNITRDAFRTADLALTAALSVSGFIVQEMERVNPTRSVFIFENSEELKEKTARYWRGELQVEPQSYFNQLKILKARIYEH
jgi:pyruvate kinase